MSETSPAPINGAELPEVISADPPPPDAVKALLAEFQARDDVKAIVIGFVEKTGKSSIRMTPMSLPEAGHLARMLTVRVDNEYAATMRGGFPTPRAPVNTGGHQARPTLTPKELQVLAGAMKRKGAVAAKRRAPRRP